MADALTTTNVSSERVRLARAALGAALLVPGVRSGDARHAHFTVAGEGERLDGVTCMADGRGGYNVSLQLVCEPVRLAALAAQIRSRVIGAVDGAGLTQVLAGISVCFSDLALGEELT